jgi:hypothetical protein
MRRLVPTIVSTMLATAWFALAATNLNSSKSNAYRLTFSTTLVTPAQASAILAELDKTPGLDEAALKVALPPLLKKNGIDPAKVKKTLIRPGGADRKSSSIILLDRAEDEAAAIAVSDEGAGGQKPVKKSSVARN